MEHDFWHERWNENRIGFHEGEANAMLVKHLPALSLPAGARVFVPLCGKTRDIAWLLAQGYRVAGAELSELAVQQLFADLGTTPMVTQTGALKRYSVEGIDIFAGDIFALTTDLLGQVDAVYDRAALVALPYDMRPGYGTHVHAITGGARQLLISFEYDQSVMDGPPFAVDPTEMDRVYGASYMLKQLDSQPVEGGLKGICPAQEITWLLT